MGMPNSLCLFQILSCKPTLMNKCQIKISCILKRNCSSLFCNRTQTFLKQSFRVRLLNKLQQFCFKLHEILLIYSEGLVFIIIYFFKFCAHKFLVFFSEKEKFKMDLALSYWSVWAEIILGVVLDP